MANVRINSVNNPEIVMNWNMVEFLPEIVKMHFATVVAGYMSAVYRRLAGEEVTRTPRARRPSQAATQTVPLGIGAREDGAEFARDLITGEMTQKLFLITQRIHKKLPSQVVENESLPGIIPTTINPALEFVKSVTKVLSLDACVAAEVVKLRRNMLRLLGEGEFSEAAAWRDPCFSFVLPEVICRTCNHCRDIDMCKDGNKTVADGSPAFLCPLCNSSYSNQDLEHQLIDVLNRKMMAYVLQDLQCSKCLQIKMENLAENCTCAGHFDTLIKKEDIMRHLKTFQSIAKHFNMIALDQTITWIMSQA